MKLKDGMRIRIVTPKLPEHEHAVMGRDVRVLVVDAMGDTRLDLTAKCRVQAVSWEVSTRGNSRVVLIIDDAEIDAEGLLDVTEGVRRDVVRRLGGEKA